MVVPKNTTIAAGHNASSGRPLGSTMNNGYSVSDGRDNPSPSLAAGYSVSDGRPVEINLAAGYMETTLAEGTVFRMVIQWG